jgi:hypothetical protein
MGHWLSGSFGRSVTVASHARPARGLSAARRERYVDETARWPEWVTVCAKRVAMAGPRLRQPETWSVLLVALLAVIVVWQQPLSKAIGTAGPKALHAASATTLPAVQSPPLSALAPATPTRPVVTHAPRDPFRPLVGTNGVVRAPVTIRLPHHGVIASAPHQGSSHRTPPPSGVSAGCSAVHVVVAGESLWSISQHTLMGRGYGSVTTAWHALYAANQTRIGSNPSYLSIGERLCLPARSP